MGSFCSFPFLHSLFLLFCTFFSFFSFSFLSALCLLSFIFQPLPRFLNSFPHIIEIDLLHLFKLKHLFYLDFLLLTVFITALHWSTIKIFVRQMQHWYRYMILAYEIKRESIEERTIDRLHLPCVLSLFFQIELVKLEGI